MGPSCELLYFENEAAEKRVLTTGNSRDMPALEKDPVNDRKGDPTGPRLETSERLQSAQRGCSLSGSAFLKAVCRSRLSLTAVEQAYSSWLQPGPDSANLIPP